MMKANIINVILATLIVGLLSWWLWIMGNEPTQKWLLACVGGFIMEVGLIGTMGFYFENERSGVQTKIVFFLLTIVTFIASIIYSFFNFTPESYCIPLGLFFLICCYTGVKIYKTKE